MSMQNNKSTGKYGLKKEFFVTFIEDITHFLKN